MMIYLFVIQMNQCAWQNMGGLNHSVSDETTSILQNLLILTQLKLENLQKIWNIVRLSYRFERGLILI